MTGPRLSADEIEAILAVAGNADAEATFESSDADDRERLGDAFETGMDKLREMLARRRSRAIYVVGFATREK